MRETDYAQNLLLLQNDLIFLTIRVIYFFEICCVFLKKKKTKQNPKTHKYLYLEFLKEK